jgi:hypothetical protein
MGGEVEHDEGLITQRLIRLDGSGLRDQLSAESEVHGSGVQKNSHASGQGPSGF